MVGQTTISELPAFSWVLLAIGHTNFDDVRLFVIDKADKGASVANTFLLTQLHLGFD